MTSRDVSDSRSWSELFVPERLRSCPYLHQVWECFRILSGKYEVWSKFIKIEFIFQNNRTLDKKHGCKDHAMMSYCMFTYAWQLITLILSFVTCVYKVIIFLRCWCNIWWCGNKYTNCNKKNFNDSSNWIGEVLPVLTGTKEKCAHAESTSSIGNYPSILIPLHRLSSVSTDWLNTLSIKLCPPNKYIHYSNL